MISGLQTVVIILQAGRQGSGPSAAFIRIKFSPLTEQGAALLGSMVSLTPGTTTIDIDMQRHELLLHVLDSSDSDAMVAGIRRDFEPGLRKIFGKEG